MIVVNPESPMQKVLRYAGMVYRQRWPVFICALIGVAVGAAVAFSLPKKYESHSLFIVEGEAIPDPFEERSQRTLERAVQERIQNLQHIILSRSFLEKVIDKSNLRYYADTPLERERLIQHLKGSITISKIAPNVVSIGYIGDHYREAAEVASIILAQYEETINEMFGEKLRGVIDFLQVETENYKRRLAEAAERRAEFKRKWIDLLPGSEGGHLSRLVNLETQLDEVELNTLAKKRELEHLKEVMAELEPEILEQSTMNQSPEVRSQLQLVDALERELQDTLLRRTEKSADVITLRERLAEARKKLQELKKHASSEVSTETRVRNPILTEQENAKAKLQMEIEGLEARRENLESEITEIRKDVDKIPELEKQLAEMTTEFELEKANYIALLREEHSRKLSKSMADHGQGANLVLLDSPQENKDPVAPKMPLIILIGLGAGAVFGGLIGFLREWLNQTVRSAEEVQSVLALPVIASVPPLVYTGEEAAPIPEKEQKRFAGLAGRGGGAARPKD
jgi:polysaccharide chain length determinant protein (PEP-CTERM system associated)